MISGKPRRSFACAARRLGLALLCFAFDVTAQTYPSKPIRVVVPNPAGGIDAYARVFQPKFAEIIGQPMLLENRPGASGAIGAENVARAIRDRGIPGDRQHA